MDYGLIKFMPDSMLIKHIYSMNYIKNALSEISLLMLPDKLNPCFH
uniref:Uncharacterized protein n=1 Tax=Anguilla anguilla TaxID=7936 RepID=A0A0E9US48_ANGAN